jgi:hypothetical protein
MGFFFPCIRLFHGIGNLGQRGMMDELLHGDGGGISPYGSLLLLVDVMGEDPTEGSLDRLQGSRLGVKVTRFWVRMIPERREVYRLIGHLRAVSLLKESVHRPYHLPLLGLLFYGIIPRH